MKRKSNTPVKWENIGKEPRKENHRSVMSEKVGKDRHRNQTMKKWKGKQGKEK